MKIDLNDLIKEPIVISDIPSIKDELIRLGLGDLEGAPFSGKPFIYGKDTYYVPTVLVSNFKELFKDRIELPKEEHRNRHRVFQFSRAVVKSPRKANFHYFNEDELKGLKSQNPAHGEIVNSYVMSRAGLPVVQPKITIVDLVKVESGDIRKRYFVLEERFTKVSYGRGELKSNQFNDDEIYRKTMIAYDLFLESTRETGYEYVPHDKDSPHADLVRRIKSSGDFEILATDCPQFRKIK